jgi:thioredoxin reductase
MTRPETEHDVLIIGGGPAGLTAALYLGRARKSVAVLDAGSPRHAVSDGVHNFLTREGTPPAELREHAWAQMSAYPEVRHVRERVASLERQGERWSARTQGGAVHTGRAVVLATGVVDEHPEIPGYAARWGHSIHHCPYCHGWEMQDLPLAVLATDAAAGHLAPLLKGWSDDVVVLSHGAALPEETLGALAAAGVPVHTQRVARLEGQGRDLERIVLEGGEVLARRGLFVAAPQRQVPLVAGLGLELDDQGYVAVDAYGATSVEGIWAAGDLTSRFQQVVVAASQGARAGGIVNAVLTLGHAPF